MANGTVVLRNTGKEQFGDNKKLSNLVAIARVKFTMAINSHAFKQILITSWV